MVKLAHLSDPHFGRIADPNVQDALVASVNRQKVDLVAISGDLTQRAKKKQFQQAVRFIDALEAPVLVVPGNHDVFPWWRPVARLVWPLHRYCKWIDEDLSPSFESEGLAVLGVNSVRGRLLKNGWIRDVHVEAIVSFFEHQTTDTYKVLVLHHHLMRLRRFGSHDVARRATTALQAVEACGVDLILCGHLHASHIEKITLAPGEYEVIIASAATATSDRGRGMDSGMNGYNLITVTEGKEEIIEKRYQPGDRRFKSYRTSRFDREVMMAE